jgi:GNAT superfamily N-acetyltransferase
VTGRPPPGVELAPLAEVAESEVLALLDRALGPAQIPRSPELWRWKHGDNPFGPSPGLVAMAKGRPVAVRVFLRWRWRRDGVDLPAARAVDTATDPSWQRRGLFRLLTLELVERLRRDGTAFLFNTPNTKSRAGYLAMGWRDAGRVPLLVATRRPIAAAAAFVGRRPAASRAVLPPPAGLQPIADLLADRHLPRFLAAWEEGAARAHTPRDSVYLAWRYGAAPGLAYGGLWHLEGDGGAVVVARASRRRGLTELSLVELLASDDRVGRAAATELLGRVAALPGIDHLVAAGAAGTPERRLLRARGFWPAAAFAPRLVVRPLTTDAGQAPLARWRPAAGDLELF